MSPRESLAVFREAVVELNKARRKLRELEARQREPIAIVGLGCRLPGGPTAEDHRQGESFWNALLDRQDLVTEIPSERWDVDAFYDPRPGQPGKMYTRAGAFLDRVDRFDAAFFGITPREAVSQDPQQRLLLEVAWEAFENAGIAPSHLAGSRTGVFVGCCNADYFTLRVSQGNPAVVDSHFSTGLSSSVMAGRLSHLLGLRGPSLVLDTACSSSLVAVHLAVSSLRQRQSDVALAGGVNLILGPWATIAVSNSRMLSPRGRCHTFDASADGFVRGEGCGVVVLKRLADAQADGDRILAVIRGSAVNHDGRSSSLTAPSSQSQERVLRDALADAGVKASEIGYIEAHGTGTELGDPIEIEALGSVLCTERDSPLYVGSVKTNLGHLEAAAGIVGLIKAVLSVRHGQLAPHLHLQALNPHVDWSALPIRIPTEATEWPAASDRRLAGVSSFGMSGTNAHLILENAPDRTPEPSATERQEHVLTLSARTERALEAQIVRYRERLGHGADRFEDICFTANAGRDAFEHRVTLVASTREAALELLSSVDESAADSRQALWRGHNAGTQPLKVGFLFSGQGSHYVGMGKALYQTYPSFKATIDQAADRLAGRLPLALQEILFEHPTAIDQTLCTQPALFALEYALADLWRSWGVVPAVVLGHSLGEYAAACVAGVFDFESGLDLVAERARRMASVDGEGAMAAALSGRDAVEAAIRGLEDQVSIAAVNGARSTVFSGWSAAVETVAERLRAAGVTTRPLPVSHAFHSPQMDPILDRWQAVADQVPAVPPSLELVSNLLGRTFAGDEVPDGRYWRRHLREPVLFETGLRAMKADILIEIGPGTTLLATARRSALDPKPLTLASVQRENAGLGTILQSAARLHAAGVDLDWQAFEAPFARTRVALPSYPFEGRRFWVDDDVLAAGAAGEVAFDRQGVESRPTHHPLLGRQLELAVEESVFESRLRPRNPRWLADHQVAGQVLLPATAMLEIALAAAAECFGGARCTLASVAFEEPLVLDGGGARTQLVVDPTSSGEAAFRILAQRLDGGWTLHARGHILASAPAEPTDFETWEAVRDRCGTGPEGAGPEVDGFYDRLAARGLEYGPAFRGVRALWRGDREACGEVWLDGGLVSESASYGVHPALLDSCLQVVGVAAERADDPRQRLPLGIDRVIVHRPPGDRLRVHARLRDQPSPELISADLVLYAESGEPVVEIQGLHMKVLGTAQSADAGGVEPWASWLYQVDWRDAALAEPPRKPEASRRWWILADESGVGEALAERLRETGQVCQIVPAAAVDDNALTGTPDVVLALGALDALPWSALDGTESEPGMDFSQDLERCCLPLVRLSRRLEAAGAEAVDLWLATRGSQVLSAVDPPAQDPAESRPAAAAAWTLTGIAALEHPGWRPIRVDLDPSGPLVEPLWDEIRQRLGVDSIAEDQTARRGTRRMVPRLTRASAPTDAFEWAGDGPVLITGGLGGLGLTIARWLAERGARHLVLTGRREPTTTAQVAIAEMASQGARIDVRTFDVGDAVAVGREVERLTGGPSPLRGVIHLAAILDDGLVRDLDPERLDGVWRPKALGAFHLHRATLDLDLDFFLLFSSSVSLFGARGQAAYGAANAVLDHLAQVRRALGKPALAVSWGLWKDLGQTADRTTRERVERQGVGGMAADDALEALSRLLVGGTAHTAVMAVDWPVLLGQFDATPALFTEFAPGPASSVRGDGDFAVSLNAVPRAQRYRHLYRHVEAEARRIMGLPAVTEIGSTTPFWDLGLDSLMAIELRNALGRMVGEVLPVTVLFDYPTLESLVGRLAETLGLHAEESSPIVEVAAASEVENEPIAIVGMSCRFPNGADDLEAYWRLLCDGWDGITEVPPSRWRAEDYYHPEPGVAGKMCTKWGGFLTQVDGFDPQFFGIAPREAVSMDPQQRVLLEVTWEALEHAGLAPDRLVGSPTGVFIGLCNNDYSQLHVGADDPDSIDVHFSTGNAPSVMAGRLSYTFGFQGPSFVVDTACSASLVSTHLAVQSLRNGECDLAVAGGVNLILGPLTTIALSAIKALSPDGLCKAFDADANGFVRGEGCGVVLLERLSTARAKGHRVLAVIRGSAINQDGRSAGLTSPNGPSQEAVIRRALAQGAIAPEAIDYIEAHGTGTALGDPIEMRVLSSLLATERTTDRPLVVGSVKTNIGHLESAAGVAGLIKAVLAIERGQIPPHLHLKRLNPLIDLAGQAVEIPRQLRDWPQNGRRKPRRAGVSSFGISGTNAHVVLEERPQAPTTVTRSSRPHDVVMISARTPTALRRLAERYAALFDAERVDALADIAATSRIGRSHFEHRLVIAAETVVDGRDRLLAWLAEGTAPGIYRTGLDSAGQSVEVIFACPPETRLAGGEDLYAESAAFRAAVDTCVGLVPTWQERVPETLDWLEERSTVASFIRAYALGQLWRSWGVEPWAVCGWGRGELAAVCLAGGLSLDDGLRLAVSLDRLADDPAASRHWRDAVAQIEGHEPTVRCFLGSVSSVQQLPDVWRQGPEFASEAPNGIDWPSGARALVLGATSFEAASVPWPDALVCDDSASGAWAALLDAVAQLYAAGLDFDWSAFDGDRFGGDRREVQRVTLPSYPFERQRYWVDAPPQGLRTPPRPADRAPGHPLLGRRLNSPRLEGAIFESELSASSPSYLADHRVGGVVYLPAAAFLELALAGAHAAWPDAPWSVCGVVLQHPLRFEEGAGATVQLVLAGRDDSAEATSFWIYSRPTDSPDEAEWTTHVEGQLRRASTLDPEDAHGLVDDPEVWSGGYRGNGQGGNGQGEVDIAQLYEMFSQSGMVYGPAFQALESLHAATGSDRESSDHESSGSDPSGGEKRQCRARLALPEVLKERNDGVYRLHPILLDAAFQSLAGLSANGTSDGESGPWLPLSIESLTVQGEARPVACRTRLATEDAMDPVADLDLFDALGHRVAEVRGLRLRRLEVPRAESAPRPPRRVEASSEWRELIYEPSWRPSPLESAGEIALDGQTYWLFTDGADGADGEDFPRELARRLEARGASCLRVARSSPGEDRKPADGVHWLDPERVEAGLKDLLAEFAAGPGATDEPLRLVALWGFDPRRSASAETPHEPVDPRSQERVLGGLVHLSRALAAVHVPARLHLVTWGSQSGVPASDGEAVDRLGAAVWGLGGSLAHESPEWTVVRLDLGAMTSAAAVERLIEELVRREASQATNADEREDQIAWRGETRSVRRLEPSAWAVGTALDATGEGFALMPERPGLIDSLRWVPASRQEIAAGCVEIEVEAAGLNFRDVLNVLDLYPGDAGPLGNECAGRIHALGPGVTEFEVGQDVLAIAPASFGRYAITPAAFVVPRPTGLSREAAATLPVVFATAELALNEATTLRAGETILIHAATGGVGQAAIQLARRAGAEIFATAGRPEKREFLRQMGLEHVFDSRTPDFAGQIRERTGGRGVDVVLNALAGEMLDRSLEIVTPGGRFLEIGKGDILTPDEAAARRPDVGYHIVALDDVMRQDPERVGVLLRRIATAVNDGMYQPLPLQVYGRHEVVRAFRWMERARHIGKVVIRQPRSGAFERWRVSEGTVLITGGLGGLGRSVARWLVERGARHLALVGRSGASAEAQPAIEALQAAGAEVRVFAADVADVDQTARLFAEVAASLPPVRGVIHAAGVLADGLVAEQTWDDFARVLAPKIEGSWNLHQATQDLELEFFVLFGSSASLFGPPGQGAYAAANAYLDGLAHHRRALGQPAVSLDWGAWASAGMAASLDERDRRRLRAMGLGELEIDEGTAILQAALAQQAPAQLAALRMDWRRLGERGDAARDPLLRELLQPRTEATQTSDLRDRLRALDGEERRLELLRTVMAAAAQVLGLDGEEIEPRVPFVEYGLDSLMAVELRNTLAHRFATALPATLLFNHPTAQGLADHLAERLEATEHTAPEAAVRETAREPTAREDLDGWTGEQPDSAADVPGGEEWERIDQLSGAELEDELLRELQKEGY